jgi:hypothetical protein
MRWSHLGMNVLAMAAFATPAVLIFASSGPTLAKSPIWAGAAVASLLVGLVSLFASMVKLSAGRTQLAVGLMAAGLGLVGLPVFALVFAPA